MKHPRHPIAKFARLVALAILVLVTTTFLFSTSRHKTMLRLCLFSPVKGIVVQNGKPVAGAVVKRTWKFAKERSDETVTDENGEFSFPGAYTRNVLWQFLPAETSTFQRIEIEYSGKTFLGWSHRKTGFDEYDELDILAVRGEGRSLNGKPIDLICELNREVTNHGGVWGYGGIAELR